ncbi:MAG: UDP-3-O-(3-hydroxymyristoyl)glucosamine N-acyltransferase [Gemmataceae bacterium]
MPITLAELASLVEGQVHGCGQLSVHAARALQDAGPADITFIEHERNARNLRECRAGVVVVPRGLANKLPEEDRTRLTLLEVADPLGAFVRIVQHLQGEPHVPPAGIDPSARVDPSATIGPDCSIMPLAVIGRNVKIGARCQIHPHVVIGADCTIGADVILNPGVVLYSNTVIGDRVIVHANTVLGADGFGYRFQNGRHVKVPQLGYVEIGNDVEIGACTTIDRGTFQATQIGQGTKIDNLVMIAHNCRIGAHNLIVSQVGIAGSCNTGEFVVIAGQVGVADHVTIHDRAVIGAGSGVPSDIPAGQRYLGYPCWPEREARRILMSMSSLPGVCKDVRLIKQRLGIDEPKPSRNAG